MVTWYLGSLNVHARVLSVLTLSGPYTIFHIIHKSNHNHSDFFLPLFYNKSDKQRNENGQNNVSVMGDQSNIDRARDMIDRIINDDRDREEHHRD